MQVVIQKMPESLPEFQARIAEGRQPEHICALFLCALALFERDRDAGTAAMDILRGPRPMTPYDCQFLRDRLRGKAYLPLAYFEGATPQNGYQPCVPYTLNVLAESDLPAYRKPSSDSYDEVDSEIRVVWRTDDGDETQTLSGSHAEALEALVLEIAEAAYTAS